MHTSAKCLFGQLEANETEKKVSTYGSEGLSP